MLASQLRKERLFPFTLKVWNLAARVLWSIFEVDDVDAVVRDLKSKGLTFEADPIDQEWLWREAYLRDPSGNWLCIYHAGESRRFPAWRVKDPGE
jgi:hydroxymethylpyrimidine/phosphomethylpyrimidine kinase